MKRTEKEHVSKEELLLYVGNQLDDSGRSRVEQELMECEVCLAAWLDVMDDEIPASAIDGQPNMALLEERVIGELLREAMPANDLPAAKGEGAAEYDRFKAVPFIAPKPERPRSRFTLLQNPIVQYSIAASITLLLMASGLFTGLSEELAKLDEEHRSEASYMADEPREFPPTWSERAITRTGEWLDGLQHSRFYND